MQEFTSDTRSPGPSPDGEVGTNRKGHVWPRTIRLPDGRKLDLHRSRWEGVLRPEEIMACRRLGIPLGYDCAQNGWIAETFPDAHDEPGAWSPPPASVSPASVSPFAPPAPEAGPERIERREPVGEDGVEALGARLRDTFREDAERLLAAEDGGQASPVWERLEQRGVAAVEEIAETRGVRFADRCHWVIRSTLAAARPPRVERSRAAPSEPPGASAEASGFTFRRWTDNDVEIYMELLANPKVWEYLPEPFPTPFTTETARTLIEVGSFDFHHQTMAVERDGTPIGQCLLRLDPDLAGVRAAEVAYWLGEEHWGKGYMSRILPAFTAHCCRTRDVDVIYAWIREDHAASRRVAERAGYRRDTFPRERELAEALGRPAFIRLATFREEWSGSDSDDE